MRSTVEAGRDRHTPLPAPREPGLDGIRAIAVLAVLAFHGELTWSPGGFLGVDVFFVLSGYLITSRLLAERGDAGSVDVTAFWSRRMRRILPALLVLCAGLVVFAMVGALPLDAARTLPGDAAAALLSVANWRFLIADQGYFDLTSSPSLLEHTWSLSIEEQYYLLWAPLLAFVLLRRRSRDRRGPLTPRFLGGVLVGMLVAVAMSAAWMAYRAGDAWSAGRAYWDTFARLQGPLIGAALAFAFTLPIVRRAARKTPPIAGTVLAVAGLAVLAGLFWRVDSSSRFLFPGGFLLAALASAAVIGGIRLHPKGLAARGLSIWPLAALGLISYGVYLWHWPLLFVLSGSRTGLSGVTLHAIRFAATVALAAGSYLLIERWAQRRRDGLARTSVAFAAAIAVVVVAFVLVLPPADAPTQVELAVPPPEAFEAPDVTGTILPESPGTTAPTRPAATATPVTTQPQPTTTVRPTTTTTRFIAPGPRVRIAFFGDSVAESIARALIPVGPAHNVEVLDDSIFGCGVAPNGTLILNGNELPEANACLAWHDTWAERLDRDKPDVAVMVIGRHEIANRQFEGEWTSIGSPRFDEYLRGQMRTAVHLALDRNIPVVLLTSPFYVGGEAPGGGIRPENEPVRVHRLNRLLESVAAEQTDGRVRLVDLGGLTSPRGLYAGAIDGVQVRSDGVHFAAGSGVWLAPRLLPPIVAVVR